MLKQLKCIGTVGRMYCDNPPAKFMDSLVEMLQFSHLVDCKAGEYIHYAKGQCSWHILGRNMLAKEFRGDWLLQLDTDHIFAPDMLHRLLMLKQKHNAPVLSVVYGYKFPPHGPVMGIWDHKESLAQIYDYPRDVDIFEVGAVGGGGLLVDRSVFNAIAETGEHPFDTIGGLSEDYSFCLRCKRLGIPVLVAPQVESHHLIYTAIHMEDYKPNREDFTNAKPIQASGGTILPCDSPQTPKHIDV